MLLKDVPLRTWEGYYRHGLFCSNSTLLVLNRTSLKSDSALLVLNRTSLKSDSVLRALNTTSLKSDSALLALNRTSLKSDSALQALNRRYHVLLSGVSHRAYVELRSAACRLRRAYAALRCAYAGLYVAIRRGTQRGTRDGRKKLNMFNFSRTFGVEHWTQFLRYCTPCLRNSTLPYASPTKNPLRLA